MSCRIFFVGLFLWMLISPVLGQPFSRADSLRGSLNPLRSCYDVTYYDLELKLDAKLKRIAGRNQIHFRAVATFSRLQIDLFDNMQIDEITWNGRKLHFEREYHAVFIDFPQRIRKGSQQMIEIYYAGAPREAKSPPWDGGFVWEKDDQGKDWIGVACEGLGASVWWPGKDHLSDEPDSMQVSVIYPKEYYVVANGNLRSTEDLPGAFRKWTYFIQNPINNYNISLYIGDYVKFTDVYKNNSGFHELKYYVLSYNEAKARKHFRQVKDMLLCFEKYFGEYPFWSDGFALVETSYWGMEHQSAIAYGNEYKNNEFDFDFIIVHESGHEWFGNSLSVPDHAEMWIHEGFTTYAEALYVEDFYGYERAVEYLNSQRGRIRNEAPMLGPMGVNYDGWPHSDIYFKGSWMLHTLRNVVDDDGLWFACLKRYCENFRISSVNTTETIDFFNWQLGENYDWFFEQYLEYASLPVLEYRISKNGRRFQLEYRWEAAAQDFNMPIEIEILGVRERILPSEKWQSLNRKGVSERHLTFDRNFGLYELRKLD